MRQDLELELQFQRRAAELVKESGRTERQQEVMGAYSIVHEHIAKDARLKDAIVTVLMAQSAFPAAECLGNTALLCEKPGMIARYQGVRHGLQIALNELTDAEWIARSVAILKEKK